MSRFGALTSALSRLDIKRDSGIPWDFKTFQGQLTRPGKHSQFANLKMAIEIVDLPIDSMVIFHSYGDVYQRVGFKVHK